MDIRPRADCKPDASATLRAARTAVRWCIAEDRSIFFGFRKVHSAPQDVINDNTGESSALKFR
jgi:hypothetical protein